MGTINAAIVALAKAFSDRGITDGVQVNSVLPGPVMTGRRRSYLQHWAPLHDMTVEEATANSPKEAGIARYGRAGGNRRTDGLPGVAGRTLDDRLERSGWMAARSSRSKLGNSARRRPSHRRRSPAPAVLAALQPAQLGAQIGGHGLEFGGLALQPGRAGRS